MPPLVPKTTLDWQVAVDAANALLLIDAARAYGLISGGPKIDVQRCEEMLTRGAARGIMPRQDSPDRCVSEWNAQANRLVRSLVH